MASYSSRSFYSTDKSNNYTYDNSKNANGYNGYARSQIAKIPSNMPIKKDFYTFSDVSKPHSYDFIAQYYEKEGITLQGTEIPSPIIDFNEFPWPRIIKSGFDSLGYDKPTPIQSQGWPIALAGRDMVGIAMTGSGKTLSYILPALVHIDSQLNERQDYGPMVLVLAPTRELAQQIHQVVIHFRSRFSSACIFGGASKGGQIRDINRNRPQLIIATPGRLNDFIESSIISLNNVSYLVLDEADRMLDMGFEPQIRKIVAQIPSTKRQTLMWSATWPKEVRALAEDFLVNYIQVNIGALQLHANHNITQIVDMCEEIEKSDKLFRLLEEIMREEKENKTLIFAETKKKVDDLTKRMRYSGWPAMCIHGDKNQTERDWVLKEFRSGRSPILVATDVAARGLDVEDIKYVINFDYPNTSEDYVHRIGRTGRKNNKGTAYTFFTKANSKQAYDLINVLQEAKQIVNPKLFESMRTPSGPDKYRRYGTSKKAAFSNKGNAFSQRNNFSYMDGFSMHSDKPATGHPVKRKSRFDNFDGRSPTKQAHYESFSRNKAFDVNSNTAAYSNYSTNDYRSTRPQQTF